MSTDQPRPVRVLKRRPVQEQPQSVPAPAPAPSGPPPADEPYVGLMDGKPVRTGMPHVLVSGFTGSGKALALSTPIPTPSGFTRMGEITAGDVVFGRDGRPCTVTDVWAVIDSPTLYRLTLSDGQQILADADHQWVVSSFTDRNHQNTAKRRNAISTWNEARTISAALRAQAPSVDGDTALPDLPGWLHGLIPETEQFFGSEFSLRLVLDAQGVPFTQRRRKYTRAYAAMTFQQDQSTVHFPLRAALEVLSAGAIQTGQHSTTRARNDRRKAARRLLAGPVDDTMAPIGEIVDLLREHGATLPDTSPGSCARQREIVRRRLKDAGVAHEHRIIPVTVHRANPSSQVVYGRPTRFYDNRAVLLALADRLDRRYENRPTADVVEQTLTTAEMIEGGLRLTGGHTNWAIRVPAALELPEATLPVAPYVLGAWLGDGSLHRSDFTQSTEPSHPSGLSDMDHLRAELTAAGYEPSEPYSYAIHVSETTLKRHLDEAGVLDHKHIPIRYLRASRAQRLSLLQGLMDTDGTIGDSGNASIGFSDRRLAEDTLALVRSLGIKASITWNKAKHYTHKGERRAGRLHHTITFTTTEQVVRLPRKSARLPEKTRETQNWLYVVDVEAIGPGHPEYEPARCIAVDSDDATFLAGPGFLPTHNSRTVLAPAALEWGARPAVVVSSKADLAGLCAPTRARYGPTYLMDLSAEVKDSDLGGAPVTRVGSDPTTLIHNDDSAMSLAGLLQEVGPLITGNGSGGGGGGDGEFWKSLALPALAGVVRAAGTYYDIKDNTDKPGGGIRWAIEAAMIEEGPGQDAEGNVDLEVPSWDTAIHRLRSIGSRHALSLEAAKRRPDEQRSSIGINMQVAMNSWLMDEVAGDGTAPPFRPAMLEEPGASLFIVSPLSGGGAPAAAATLTALVDHWRKRVDELPSLLMIVDELPNTSPLPRLANWVGEARGLGIRLVAAVQASSQFERKWGAAGMRELRDLFPQVLILPPGGLERELLDAAAWTTGHVERGTASTDVAGHVSGGRDKVEAVTGPSLLPPKDGGKGRLLIAGTPGHLVDLPDIDRTTLRVDRPRR